MTCEGHHCTLCGKPGAPTDIGHEECDRAYRKIAEGIENGEYDL